MKGPSFLEFLVVFSLSLGVLWAVGRVSYDIGYMEATLQMEQEAIKRGVAEMVIVDKLTGKTEFAWLVEEVEEEK